MTDTGFESQAFQVAADRKLGRPLRIERTVWVQDWNDPDDEGEWQTYSFRIDPNTDMIRLGVAMGAMGNAMSGIGNDAIEDVETKIGQIDKALPVVRKALRDCVVPPDRAGYDDVSAKLGVKELSEVIQQIMGGVAGMDPTQRASLSDGSPITGPTSTDGAQPAA